MTYLLSSEMLKLAQFNTWWCIIW